MYRLIYQKNMIPLKKKKIRSSYILQMFTCKKINNIVSIYIIQFFYETFFHETDNLYNIYVI